MRGLFLSEERPRVWRVMLERSRRLGVGEALSLESTDRRPVSMTLLESCGQGQWFVSVDADGSTEELLGRVGIMPLPPYIRRESSDARGEAIDRSRYQTVYARCPGAVAAPTAGLHITESMLKRMREREIETAFVTLHVGLGTFKPIEVDFVSDHAMHMESFDFPEETAGAIRQCRARGGRVVAVGTTTVRVLESVARNSVGPNVLVSGNGSTDIFIRPPFDFHVVDVLLTNFHLPRSTLLALVMAFAGVERTRRAYAHAATETYRFYSYGDAMLIV